jgi:hypothetical protein
VLRTGQTSSKITQWRGKAPYMIIALDCKQIEDTLQLCLSRDTSAPQHQPKFKNVLRSCRVRRLALAFYLKDFL